MAVKVVVSRVCDRCSKPYGEQQMDYKGGADTLQQIERTTLTITTKVGASETVVLAQYDDLCDPCSDAVTNYVKRIRMEKVTRAKGTSAEGTSEGDETPTATETAAKPEPVVVQAPVVEKPAAPVVAEKSAAEIARMTAEAELDAAAAEALASSNGARKTKATPAPKSEAF